MLAGNVNVCEKLGKYVGELNKVSNFIKVSNVVKLVIYFSPKCPFGVVDCSLDNPAESFSPKTQNFSAKF